MGSLAAKSSAPVADKLNVADQPPEAGCVEKAIAEFQSNPGSPSLLRNLAREHPDLFFAVAAKHLESVEDSPAYRLLARLLIRHASFFHRFADPARCSCESAVHLFRCLLKVEPALDVRLARMLPGRNHLGPGEVLNGKAAERAMVILDQTSPGPRLRSVVAHLPNSTDPRHSSKGALFLGRRVNHPAWTARQLLREDQRLRANALEASWGTKSEAAIRILEACVGDANPRVAGNALIGLHLAMCPGVPARVLALSESTEPGLRSTAAWVMARIGDPAFISRLTALLRDESPRVRSTAVRSLIEIGRAEKRRIAGSALEPAAAEPVPAPLPAEAFELMLDGSSFRSHKGA